MQHHQLLKPLVAYQHYQLLINAKYHISIDEPSQIGKVFTKKKSNHSEKKINLTDDVIKNVRLQTYNNHTSIHMSHQKGRIYNSHAGHWQYSFADNTRGLARFMN